MHAYPCVFPPTGNQNRIKFRKVVNGQFCNAKTDFIHKSCIPFVIAHGILFWCNTSHFKFWCYRDCAPAHGARTPFVYASDDVRVQSNKVLNRGMTWWPTSRAVHESYTLSQGCNIEQSCIHLTCTYTRANIRWLWKGYTAPLPLPSVDKMLLSVTIRKC